MRCCWLLSVRNRGADVATGSRRGSSPQLRSTPSHPLEGRRDRPETVQTHVEKEVFPFPER